MICPRGSWDVYRLSTRVEAFEEGTAYPQCAGPGDGLSDGDAVFLDGGGIWAVREECGGFGEGGDTGNAGVFFVEGSRDDFLFGGADAGQDVGFTFVVACTRRSVVIRIN
jgi:hypothetical protein